MLKPLSLVFLLALVGCMRDTHAPQSEAEDASPYAGLYTTLSDPLIAQESEIIEFFSYNCSHCAEAEATIVQWRRDRGQDVRLHRVPVVFHKSWLPSAATFATFASIDVEPEHAGLFEVFQRGYLGTHAEVIRMAEDHGVSEADFNAAMGSEDVRRRLADYSALTTKAGVSGVPAFVVAGKYLINLERCGSIERALEVAGYLIAN